MSAYSSANIKMLDHPSKRWFVFDEGEIREIREDENPMGGETVVRVESKGINHWVVTCECYYDADGHWSLEITAPLENALRVAAVALEFDASIN